jgi:cytochrome c oxidase subunit II
MDPMVKLHEGFQPIMPSYQGQIQPAETAAIVELIKALRAAPAPPGLNEPWSTVTNPAPAPLSSDPAEENQ